MPGLKRLKKKKKFNYGRNPKRVKQRMEKSSKFNIKVDCKAMRDQWDNRIPLRENMEAMGIAFDANKVVAGIEGKKDMVKRMKKDRNKFVESDVVVKKVVEKPGVLKQIESEANVEA